MLSIFPPAEFVSLIFHIKIKDESQSENVPPQFRSIFENKSPLIFPILSKSDLSIIQKTAKENNASSEAIVSVLSQLSSFEFMNYSYDKLSTIFKFGQIPENSADYLIAIFFHIFLAFFKPTNKDKRFKPIFDGLLCILNSSVNLKYIQKASSLAISGFVFLFNYLLDNNMVTDYSQLFSPFSQLLTLGQSIPPETFNLTLKLHNVLIKPQDIKLGKTATQYLNFVVIVLRTCGSRFPTEIATKMISVLRMALIGLDEAALLFFSRCIESISREDSTPIVYAFPTALETVIEGFKSFTEVCEISGEKLPILAQKADQILYTATDKSLLPPDLLSVQRPVFPEDINLIPHELSQKCQTIAKVVEPSNEMKLLLINLAFKGIQDLNFQPHSNELIAMYITLLTYMSPIPYEIVYALFDTSRIFDQRVTYLKETRDYIAVHSLRKLFTIFLMKQTKSTISQIFEMMRTKPYLFTDFAFRCTPKYIPFEIFKFSVEQVSISLVMASYYFQTSEASNQMLVPILTRARIGCFHVLEAIFSDKQVLSLLFSDKCQAFFTKIFAFMFEEPPRRFLLKFLLEFFKLPDSAANSKLIEEIIKTFETALKQKNFTTYTYNFVIDIINFLDNTISENSELANGFETLIPEICSWIGTMPKSENGVKVLISTISMFSAFINHHKMTQSDVSALETASRKIFGDKSSTALKNKLIGLIAGQTFDSTPEPTFLIKQPKALRLLITLFYDKNTITFLTELCKYSPINPTLCRVAQIDVFVLEKLFNLRTEDNFELFELQLNLFVEIARVSSAVSVVNQFASLFTAIHGKYISQYQYMLLSALSKLCDYAANTPIGILYDSSATISKISSKSIKDKFLVCFWFLNVSTETDQRIVECGKEIYYDIKGNEITACFGEEKQTFAYKLPYNQWTHISLSAKTKNKKNTYCFLAINGVFVTFVKFSSQLEKIPEFVFHSSSTAFLGPFGVYPYIKLRRLSKDGKKLSDKVFQVECRKTMNDPCPIAYVIPHSHNSTTKFDTYTKHTSVSINKPPRKVYDIISFVDVLAERCGVIILLPLFAEIDLTVYNKNQSMNYLEKLIEVIKKLFSINPVSQKQFAQDKGFIILSHLLMVCNQEYITFELYNKLNEVLKETTDLECRKQLILNVFVRANIWLRTDAKSLEKIMFHWSHSLAKSSLEILSKELTFTNVLTMLRRFLWINKPEDDVSYKGLRCRAEEMNITELRKSLLFVLNLIIASKGVTETDFTFLLAQIVTVIEDEQRNDLIEILKRIISDKELKMCTNEKMITLMTYLVSNNKAALEVLKLFANNISGDQTYMNEIIQVMIRLIDPNFVTAQHISPIIEVMKKSPAFFPIAAYIGFNNNTLSQVLLQIVPQCYDYEFWHIWVVTALYLGQDNPLQFLTRTPPNQWVPIFLMIDFIGRALKKDSNEYKKKFLVNLYASSSVKTKEKAVAYLTLCKFFLFYRSNDLDMSHLLSEVKSDLDPTPQARSRPPAPKLPPSIKITPLPASPPAGREVPAVHNLTPPRTPTNSPRIQTNERRQTNASMARRSRHYTSSITLGQDQASEFRNNSLFSQSQFDDSVASVISNPPIFRFSMRLNPAYQWVDNDIADSALKIWSEFRDTSFDDFALLILAFQLPLKKDNYFNLIDTSKYPLESSWAVYNKKLERCNLQPKLQPSEYIPAACKYLESIDDVMNIEYTKFINQYKEKIVKGFIKFTEVKGKVEGEFVDLIATVTQAFISNQTTIDSVSTKHWNHLWHQLTMDNAPWYHSLPPEHRKEKHFKRDSASCFCFCPFKQRRNFEFDDHLKESYARDTGDTSSAQEMYTKYLEELKEKYQNSEPPEIFNVIEEPEDSQTAIYNLSDSKVELDCEIISLTRTIQATFYLKKTEVVINNNTMTKVIPMNSIKYIFRRTVLHRSTAIEIFMYNGESVFINFPSLKSKAAVKEFDSIPHPNIKFIQKDKFQTFFQNSMISTAWSNGMISNFEYLMLLNVYSGRSFNNTSQYPIFPWILKNYDAHKIDLNNEDIYRDLSKPVGALEPERLKNYIESYKNYEEAGMIPFMYSSAPVSPLSIYLFLLREEPFTTLHTEMQSGRFDNPARLFTSMHHTWYTIMNQVGDFRELIPEFFFSSEFLENKNKFDLGKSNGTAINDVKLPLWAESPMDFIYIHRKALESEYVSKHLHEWIDLIWGAKQRSFEANNVFKPEMYSDIWKTKTGLDMANRPEIEAILMYVGQIPKKLFNEPHPQRNNSFKLRHSITSIQHLNLECEHKILCCYVHGKKIISITVKGDKKVTEISFMLKDTTQQTKPKSFIRRLSSITLSAVNDAAKTVALQQQQQQQQPNQHTHIRGFSSIHTRSEEIASKGFTGIPVQTIFKFANFEKAVIVGNAKNDTYCISLDTLEPVRIMENRNEVVAIDADNQYIAAVDSDAILSVYETNNLKQPLFSIPSYREAVKCLAVSSTFHCVVCGTRDSSLLFCSINNRSFTKSVDLNNKVPTMVLVTPCWGFSVVQTKVVNQGQRFVHMSLYSVNGDLIRETELQNNFILWSTFRSKSGFDYIVAADEKMNVFAFEAFYLEIGDPIHKSSTPIVTLSFLESDEAVVIVDEDGKAVFIPYKC
ncbi:hypothetical protein TRFO_30109 [Tritrichomonas foetus]|uniref:Beige/BEACH domain containing protein n=1 Tax=Tritrichomonas foetus TaxID=1144522 RepID=A0A1J4JYV2_9EUKA|nr:hypothetical protein TRFO_30109 [Tritrichomonas foetus]|eukprot:OHT02708.1 hypothetical protein TRFO_30109 [Tritrichomonas foetus]